MALPSTFAQIREQKRKTSQFAIETLPREGGEHAQKRPLSDAPRCREINKNDVSKIVKDWY